MEDILTIPAKDISTSALSIYTKFFKSDLLVIDDIMLFPFEGICLFIISEISANKLNSLRIVEEKGIKS